MAEVKLKIRRKDAKAFAFKEHPFSPSLKFDDAKNRAFMVAYPGNEMPRTTILLDSHDKPIVDMAQLMAAPEGKVTVDPGEDFRDEKELEKGRLERLERQKNLEVRREKDTKPQRALSQKLSNSKERKRTSSMSFGDNFKKLFRKSDKEKTKKKKEPEPSKMKLRMEALYGHPAENEGELAFRQGDIICCDEEEVVDSDWRYGMKNGKVGLVPHVLLKPAPIYVVRAEALHTYDTDHDDELAFMQGDIVLVEPKPKTDDDWWYGEFNGRTGLFPKHFVKVLQRFQVKAQCIESFKAFRFDQVSVKKGDIMLVEKYEPSGGEYLFVEFGHRAGLVPSKHIEILNIQKVQARGLHHYRAKRNDEISFNEDDVLILLDGIPQGDDWLRAEFDGKKGLVPANYVEPITTFQVKAEAIYDYKNNNNEELNFVVGDVIMVDSAQAFVSDWWTGTLNGKTGIFPAQYVKIAERFQVQAQVLYNYNAVEEDELNVEENDYLRIEPNKFNSTGFVFAEKGIDIGYVADNYIRILGSFLKPVEEKKKKEKLVFKEVLGVFEEMAIYGDQTKDFAERIARNTAESFPLAQLQTSSAWVHSEEQHFLHKIEMEQSRTGFIKGDPVFESSTDWKALLPIIPLTFEDEKVSEEELLRPEPRRRTIVSKRTVRRPKSAKFSPEASASPSTDSDLVASVSVPEGISEGSESQDLDKDKSLEEADEEGRPSGHGSSADDLLEDDSDMEEVEEEFEEEIIEEEPEAPSEKKKLDAEEKRLLANLDSIQLSYLRHMGTLFESLEFERQTLDQHREQIIDFVPKPAEVLKLSHLIPPIYSISRSLVDDEDPDAIKLPRLVFSKNLRKLKEKLATVEVNFAPTRPQTEPSDKPSKVEDALATYQKLKAHFFERCMTIYLVNQLVVFESLALGTPSRNKTLLEKLPLYTRAFQEAVLPTLAGFVSLPVEDADEELRRMLGRFGSLFEKDGFDSILKVAKTLCDRMIHRFSGQLPYLTLESLQTLAKCSVAFMSNYVVTFPEETRANKIEEFKSPYSATRIERIVDILMMGTLSSPAWDKRLEGSLDFRQLLTEFDAHLWEGSSWHAYDLFRHTAVETNDHHKYLPICLDFIDVMEPPVSVFRKTFRNEVAIATSEFNIQYRLESAPEPEPEPEPEPSQDVVAEPGPSEATPQATATQEGQPEEQAPAPAPTSEPVPEPVPEEIDQEELARREEEKRLEEARRLEEEKRLEEERRLAEERRLEEERLLEEERAREEQRRKEEELKEKERQEEEERRYSEIKRMAEEKKEEERQAKIKAEQKKEEERQAKIKADKERREQEAARRKEQAAKKAQEREEAERIEKERLAKAEAIKASVVAKEKEKEQEPPKPEPIKTTASALARDSVSPSPPSPVEKKRPTSMFISRPLASSASSTPAQTPANLHPPAQTPSPAPAKSSTPAPAASQQAAAPTPAQTSTPPTPSTAASASPAPTSSTPVVQKTHFVKTKAPPPSKTTPSASADGKAAVPNGGMTWGRRDLEKVAQAAPELPSMSTKEKKKDRKDEPASPIEEEKEAAIPVWKQAMIEKKKKQEEEERKKALEESNIPAWKKAIIDKKKKEEEERKQREAAVQSRFPWQMGGKDSQ